MPATAFGAHPTLWICSTGHVGPARTVPVTRPDKVAIAAVVAIAVAAVVAAFGDVRVLAPHAARRTANAGTIDIDLITTSTFARARWFPSITIHLSPFTQTPAIISTSCYSTRRESPEIPNDRATRRAAVTREQTEVVRSSALARSAHYMVSPIRPFTDRSTVAGARQPTSARAGPNDTQDADSSARLRGRSP